MAMLLNSYTAYNFYTYLLLCVLPVIGVGFMMTVGKSK